MDVSKFLEFIYSGYDKSDSYVCIMTVPAFDKKIQRFVLIADLFAKIKKWLGFLRVANERGSNIYISVYPLKTRRRTEDSVVDKVNFVFLDFDSEEPFSLFLRDYTPSVIVRTSQGKHQVFLQLSQAIIKDEAKKISRGLSYSYLADKTFDLARVFRIPGFKNLKYSPAPYASVVAFNSDVKYDPDLLPRYSDFSDVKAAITFEVTGRCDFKGLKDYSYFLAQAPLKKNGEPDYSVADMKYCIYLISCSVSEATVRNLLMQNSPKIFERKKGGLENYLNKTISRAREYVIPSELLKPY